MVCPLRPPCLAPTCPYRYPIQDGANRGSGDVRQSISISLFKWFIKTSGGGVSCDLHLHISALTIMMYPLINLQFFILGRYAAQEKSPGTLFIPWQTAGSGVPIDLFPAGNKLEIHTGLGTVRLLQVRRRGKMQRKRKRKRKRG